ncbi:MAG: hypothetical protein OQL19_14430 [Gammaproteobacteria bacterium]|nr:hypothetical protein [Gammaproteobacteria bacterium]
MKKFFKKILAAVGLSSQTEDTSKIYNVNSTLYSMPTISGDSIEYLKPTKESFEGAPEFHEDEWCQLEFFPESFLDDIKKILIEYKDFEMKYRANSGWEKIFVRKIKRNFFKLNLSLLKNFEWIKDRPAPLLKTTSHSLGQVKNGFSFSVGEGALLYGVHSDEGIISLAANVFSDTGNKVLTNTFTSLREIEELILVDWRGQMIITGTNNDGKLSIWKP